MSVNPGMPMSGLIGERKADNLEQLIGSRFLARFVVLKSTDTISLKFESVNKFMQSLNLSYPVVMKPDFGQRGTNVEVIRSDQQAKLYLQSAQGDIIVQEYIGGEEFGVFYYRHPVKKTGEIFSITEKTFPVLVGDGCKSLEQLIMENPRTHYMAHYLLDLHKDTLDLVLDDKELFKAVEIGSHCRGSVFLDGSQNITPELTDQIDKVSQQFKQFCFGRYDIRVTNAEDLRAGHSFKILEVNGVTSESTNIYDPANSVLTAYKILFKQWRLAFVIGKQNIDLGAKKVSLLGLLRHLRKTYY